MTKIVSKGCICEMLLFMVSELAFNDSNYRFGYGDGYCDNFMVQNPLA